MNFKKLLLSLVLATSIISIRAEEQEKTAFAFKVFNSEEECGQFIKATNVFFPFLHPIAGLNAISKETKEQAKKKYNLVLPEDFKEKYIEAMRFLVHNDPHTEENFKGWRTLFFTINENKIYFPEEYKNAPLLYPDIISLALEGGADLSHTFQDASYDEIAGKTFEEVLDMFFHFYECDKVENRSQKSCKEIKQAQKRIHIFKQQTKESN